MGGKDERTRIEAFGLAPGALEQRRRDQNHPLRWRYAASAQALSPGVAMTRRETQERLSVDYHRDTIRSLLALLARDGRVLAKGDVLQPRYRLAEDT
jgi:hypothetical protein